MVFTFIDPRKHKDWNALLATHQNASIFHTANWAQVLSQTYGYTPRYLCRVENDQIRTLLPLMAVHSRLTGRRLVSLPFTDHVPILAEKRKDFKALFAEAVSLGKAGNYKYIELRSEGQFLKDQRVFAKFLNHRIDLGTDETILYKSFRSNTRRNIRKAENNGIKVEFSNSMEALKQFYRLNCLARKDHGLPPQPFKFFQQLNDHLLSKSLGLIVSGNYKGRTVSANLYLIYNGIAVYKYGANDRAFFRFCPSYLVMWEAIRYFLTQGMKTLDFGRTDIDDHGLRQFKRGWGTQESTNNYYRYDLNSDRFISARKGMKTSYPVFKYMPLPLLQILGKILYRHVG